MHPPDTGSALARKRLSRRIAKQVVPGSFWPIDQKLRRAAKAASLATLVALADLDFEECVACSGTGADDEGRTCTPCKGLGTLAVWSGL